MEATVQHAYSQLRVKSQAHPLLLADAAVANSMQPQREKFVEMLFERFQVPALYLARSAVLSACVPPSPAGNSCVPPSLMCCARAGVAAGFQREGPLLW